MTNAFHSDFGIPSSFEHSRFIVGFSPNEPREDAHCRANDANPFCVIGKCVECFTSQQCPFEKPYCDDFVCRECFESWQCGPDERCDSGVCLHF